MGGKNSGRRADLARRRRAASLYAGGLSLAQVAARLSCTRQGAQYLLRAAGVDTGRAVPVPCPCCGAVAARLPAGYHPPASALCLACLATRPDVPFGDRLRACRVAAGLSLRQLARRSGVGALTLAAYEANAKLPAGHGLAKLLEVVGGALVPGCERLPAAPPGALPGQLRACRRAAGLGQKEVAARCGLHPVQLNAYERGRRPPPWGALRRLVAVFGPELLAG
jgi:transcriptional regulator with XRE-family HTH domain